MNYLIRDTEKIQGLVNRFLEDSYPFSSEVVVQLSENTEKAQWVRRWNGYYIEFNDKAWIEMGVADNKEKILNTVIHECLHHALWCEELENNDGDLDFEQELINYGADSNYEDYELEEMYPEDLFNIDRRLENFKSIKELYINML